MANKDADIPTTTISVSVDSSIRSGGPRVVMLNGGRLPIPLSACQVVILINSVDKTIEDKFVRHRPHFSDASHEVIVCDINSYQRDRIPAIDQNSDGGPVIVELFSDYAAIAPFATIDVGFQLSQVNEKLDQIIAMLERGDFGGYQDEGKPELPPIPTAQIVDDGGGDDSAQMDVLEEDGEVEDPDIDLDPADVPSGAFAGDDEDFLNEEF